MQVKTTKDDKTFILEMSRTEEEILINYAVTNILKDYLKEIKTKKTGCINY